jgi:hypothetical protein
VKRIARINRRPGAWVLQDQLLARSCSCDDRLGLSVVENYLAYLYTFLNIPLKPEMYENDHTTQPISRPPFFERNIVIEDSASCESYANVDWLSVRHWSDHVIDITSVSMIAVCVRSQIHAPCQSEPICSRRFSTSLMHLKQSSRLCGRSRHCVMCPPDPG